MRPLSPSTNPLNHLTGYWNPQQGTQSYGVDYSGALSELDFTLGAAWGGTGATSITSSWTPAGGSSGTLFTAYTMDMSSIDMGTEDESIGHNADGSMAGMSNGDTTLATVDWTQAGYLKDIVATPALTGGLPANITISEGEDGALRRTTETGVVTGYFTANAPTYLYSSSGQLLVEEQPFDYFEGNCAGEETGDGDPLRKDYVYIFGLPVAALFSSSAAETPDRGHNFIVPNHLGTPLRMIDQQGFVTQSPEPGPYGGVQHSPLERRLGT
jgi:hypothetical protein